MQRHAIRRLLTLLTLALSVVLPLRAQAAIVPVCDDDRMTVVPPEDEPSCTVVTTVDEATGATSAAPICDPRGASAVAPPRLLPVADARIDAAPGSGCDGGDPSPSVRPNHHDPAPSLELASAGYYAVLIPELPVPPAADAGDAPRFAPSPGGPRAGVARGVYHPPR